VSGGLGSTPSAGSVRTSARLGSLAVVGAVALRPRLWAEALRQLRLLARPGGREWLRFRLITAYGDPQRRPEPDDVVTWLDWSKRFRTLDTGQLHSRWPRRR